MSTYSHSFVKLNLLNIFIKLIITLSVAFATTNIYAHIKRDVFEFNKNIIGAYYQTVYVKDESIVVHLQPQNANSTDLFLDVKSGEYWQGNFIDLLKTYKRLDLIDRDFVRGNPNHISSNILKLLGCRSHHDECTSPLGIGNEKVIFMTFDRNSGKRIFEVVNFESAIIAMNDLLSGKESDVLSWSDTHWKLLELISEQKDILNLWMNAVRGSKDFLSAHKTITNLNGIKNPIGRSLINKLNCLENEDKELKNECFGGIELTREVLRIRNMLGIEFRVNQWLPNQNEESEKQIITLIRDGVKIGTPIENTHKIAANFFKYSDFDRKKISQLFYKKSLNSNEPDLTWVLGCFSGWVVGGDCQNRNSVALSEPQISPNRVLQKEEAATTLNLKSAQIKAKQPSSNTTTELILKNAAPQSKAIAGQENVATPTESGSSRIAPDAVSEFYRIDKGTSNKYRLFSFDESTGKLQHDTASVGGLVFVARSVGANIKEGRFEIQIAPSSQSPVNFVHGAYRVTVPLILRYTRQTLCSGISLCQIKPSGAEELSQQRNVTFILTKDNRWINTQPAKFDHLTPVVADGGKTYEQKLLEVKMLVGSNIDVKMR
jgi:hypothetical protein